MGIMSGVLEACTATAEREGATRINEIRVRIGELSEVMEDALRFAFEALSPGTLAEGARLEVEHVAARSRCVECRVEFSHGRFDVVCPQCGSVFCEAVSGRELEIESIDIDLPGDEGEAAS